MRKNGRYIPDDDEIKHVDEVLKLLTVLTGDKRFQDAQSSMLASKKERREIRMIDVISEYEARGEARGEVKVYNKMGYSADRIAEEMNLPIDEIKKILKSLEPVKQ